MGKHVPETGTDWESEFLLPWTHKIPIRIHFPIALPLLLHHPQEGHLQQSLCPVGGFRLANRRWQLFSKFIIQLAPGAALQGSHSLCLSVCWQGKILRLLLLLLLLEDII